MSRLRDELSLSAAGGAGSPSLIRAATSLHQASKTLPQSLPVFKSAEEYNKIVAPVRVLILFNNFVVLLSDVSYRNWALCLLFLRMERYVYFN